MAGAPLPGRRGAGVARILSLVVLAVLALAVLVYGAVRWLDTDSGRAFIIRQLPLYAPKSGLSVRAGRIDGSIFGTAIIHDLKISDPQGVFAEVPVLTFDWRPIDLIENRLTARHIIAPDVSVLRRPALRPSGDDRILPDIDIDIAEMRIDRLVLAAPVAGQRQVLGVKGKADIRAGRAKIDLAVLGLADGDKARSGDAMTVKLDTEPDRDRFDIAASINAPMGGAIAGILALPAPLTATLAGEGRWTVWQGQLDARLGSAVLADLAVSARSGLFAVKGNLVPAPLLHGAAARLTAGGVAIAADARIAGRTAAINASLASPALALEARGGLDFGDESINAVAVNARLLQPPALQHRVSGQNIALTARVAGHFADPLVDYRLTAARLAWGRTEAQEVRATGIAHAGSRPLLVPISVTAARLTGLGETAAPLLTGVHVDGPLIFGGGRMTSPQLKVRTDRLNGSVAVSAVLGSDEFLVTGKAGLPRYLINGIGLADILADFRVLPAAGGARVTGQARVQVTRLDNGFFRRLTEGLPAITADVDVADDLAMQFRNAKLTAPGLTLAASGSRSPDGVVKLTGKGVSRAYGPVELALAGQIEAPTVDVTLARPGLGIGLAALGSRVAPTPGGWQFTAQGQTRFGPIDGQGLIRTTAEPLGIDVSKLTLAGLTAHGTLVQTAAGPFSGTLAFTGRGLAGSAVLAAAGAVQRADIAATAKDAVLLLTVPVTIDSGSFKLAVLLPDAGPSATGRFDFTGIERDGLRLDAARGNINYADGRGSAAANVSGSSNLPFVMAAGATFAPDRISITAGGTVGDKPVRLSAPAILTRSPGGWDLASVGIITPDGTAEVSGLFGTHKALKARLNSLSLSLLSVIWPTLDFSGRVSGLVDIAMGNDGLPTGTASLRLAGLSRAGLASASTPIDVGLNAELKATGAEARAVIGRGGTVDGRAQARLGPIPGGDGTIAERLFASPVFAQIRYNGPSQAIWGLAGIEALDVRGPIAIAADISGPLGDPRITGTMRSEGARVENTTLGAVIDQVSLDSRFTASKLELTRFSGRVGKDGSISGTGGIDLSAERAFPMDLRLKLTNAQLINRDDLTGSATGTVRVATDAYGGVVSGKLAIDKAIFHIGRGGAADVPVLAVNEKNARLLGRRIIVYAPPTRWLLNLEADADRRLFVSGLGLEAEWRGNLKIKGGATTPELSGRVQLVRGDYDFAGKRFSLTKGDIRFQGVYPPDPVIDITAESSASGFTAQLSLTGTGLRPDIKFSSTPSLPEDEVLSRILFGSSVTSLSAPEAVQLAGALASLRGKGGGFNPINMVRKGLGIDRLRILPADTVTGRKTAVAAGQYIGRNVYVELATDAQGYTATNIEVSLTRSLSILSQVATLGGTSANLRWKRDY